MVLPHSSRSISICVYAMTSSPQHIVHVSLPLHHPQTCTNTHSLTYIHSHVHTHTQTHTCSDALHYFSMVRSASALLRPPPAYYLVPLLFYSTPIEHCVSDGGSEEGNRKAGRGKGMEGGRERGRDRGREERERSYLKPDQS